MQAHTHLGLVLALGAALVQAQAPQAMDQPPPQRASVRAAEVWGANYFPNVVLTSHEGKQLKFFDDLIKDKIVVIDFIYTSCPDTCPLETARLAQVASILGDRMGNDIFFYSISIDPEVDTPEVMAEYARNQGAGPGWLFLTGKARDIDLLRLKLGTGIPEAEGGAAKNHSISVVVGNQATGRWIKRSPFENPYVLATHIGDWMTEGKTPQVLQTTDYASAPQLRTIGSGEKLFRTRCTSCHIIGQDDGLTRQGPDLLGVVERRDRKWLERWLKEPDVMLAEKDPLAVQLFENANRLPMPNLRLEPPEIEALLEYIETESRLVHELGVKPIASLLNKKPTADGSCCKKSHPGAAAVANQDLPGQTVPARGGFSPLAIASMSLGLLGLLTSLLGSRFARRRRQAAA